MSQLGGGNCRSPLLPSVCQLAFGGVSSGQLTPTEIMLIAVIFSFLLEHNQQIIYFCSFITKPLLTDFLPFRDQKFGGVFAGDTGDSLSFHLRHAGHEKSLN